MSASRSPEDGADRAAGRDPHRPSCSSDATAAPTASLAALRRRADLLARIRAFFRERGVLEVETPVLCRAGAVDEHLDPIPASVRATESHPGSARSGRSAMAGTVEPLWLVTSPEHSMKRLLAAGSGPIFQITRAFRDGERGRLHNPEFAILEWYRPGWDHGALMGEVEDLVRAVLSGEGAPPDLAAEVSGTFERLTYREAFLRAAGVDPFAAPVSELEAVARERAGLAPPPHGDPSHDNSSHGDWSHGDPRPGDARPGDPRPGGMRAVDPAPPDRDDLLNAILAAVVERTLGLGRPTFLLDYPPSQAALARVRAGDPPVAERFELYVRGLELANGYHELTDPAEQERRFRAANEARRAAGKPELPIDERLLAALRSGLPPCAGVALGIDRLAMLAVGASRIDEVIAFPIERA